MYLNYLDDLPEAHSRNCKTNNNQLQKKLMDFYESGKDYAAVYFSDDEYRSSVSLYSGLRKSLDSLDIPVNVRMIQGEIYLERTD